jgi:hypothetical protein
VPPLFLAPFVVWGFLRDRRNLKTLLPALIVFFALGAWEPVRNVVLPASASSGSEQPAQAEERSYGDWRNLWRGSYILLAAPFSSHSYELRVPWSEKAWYWRRYEIYFSDLGIAFAFGVALLPLLLRRENRSPELLVVSLAAIGSVLAILPVHRRPDGIYLVGLPRFVMYLVPVILAATIPPLFRLFSREVVPRAIVIAASISFLAYASLLGARDDFAPIDYVLWARAHPGTRLVYFDPNRSTEIVDRMAGPSDVIAIDGGAAAWSYPAFGAELQRTVHLIPPGSGPPLIPGDAQWLVVDRSWNRFWGDPAFTDLGEWRTRLGRGKASPEDLRVLRAVSKSSEFELVYLNRARLQAVYRRKQ